MEFRYNEETMQELAENIRKERIIPFYGAGISADIFPTWGAYLKDLVEPEDHETDNYVKCQLEKPDCDYEGILQYLQEQYGRAFYDKTQEVFDSRKIAEEKFRPVIYEFPRLFHGPMITTNLDQVLEWIYQKSNRPLHIGLAGETGFIHDRMLKSESCLWKIHGDKDKSDSWVLTKEQYNALYGSGNASFLKLFQVFLKYKMLLFIGASLKSDKIVRLLQELYQEDHHICHYAILQAPDDETEFAAEQKRVWKLGVKPIWFTVKDNDYSSFDKILYELSRLAKVRFNQSYLPEGIDSRLSDNIRRSSELERIRDKLTVSSYAVLTGINGIGKTQLALSYACEMTREDIIFLSCVSENFQQSLYDVLKWSHELPYRTTQVMNTDYRTLFRESLQRKSHYLVIFDDVTEEEIFEYIASLPKNGLYLATTCRSSSKTLASAIVPISGMTDQEAAWLMKSRNLCINTTEDLNAVSQLNHYCDGNALWLSQAAAYMAETGEDIGHYLDEISGMQKKMPNS